MPEIQIPALGTGIKYASFKHGKAEIKAALVVGTPENIPAVQDPGSLIAPLQPGHILAVPFSPYSGRGTVHRVAYVPGSGCWQDVPLHQVQPAIQVDAPAEDAPAEDAAQGGDLSAADLLAEA